MTMKIDLHVHASERSGCSIASEEELIAAAKARGLDALVFTDHEKQVPRFHLDDLNRRHAPFRIFSGVEIHTAEEEDVLVFGIQHPRLEAMGWAYADLHRFVHEQSGFMVLAHPFRYRETINADIRAHRPDAIEQRSLNLPPHTESRIRRVAEELGCGLIYASDAHAAEGVGRFYVRLGGIADSDLMLVNLLRSRTYTCETTPA